MLSRRTLLLALGAGLAPGVGRGEPFYPSVTPRLLTFPRDFGAHPDFRNEWWYLTGWLTTESGANLGFQVTFFRARTNVDPANPSAFAARQLVIAHAALSDPARGALIHDERIARAGFGVVAAAEDDTDVHIGDWRLARDERSGAYRVSLAARGYALTLTAATPAPPFLQGAAGYSRKGPLPAQASYYYSRPQLRLRGTVEESGKRRACAGVGWLDHEWSSSPLAVDAAGWDWVGMNLGDGTALTAFEIRRQAGATGDGPVHAYAALGRPGEPARIFAPEEVRFAPISSWTSPRTRAAWPVAQQITVGDRTFVTQPLFPDQELDSRGSTGAVYWEGASTLLESGREVGRGYLEMTGYVEPLRL